jgi:hypothetical protein
MPDADAAVDGRDANRRPARSDGGVELTTVLEQPMHRDGEVRPDAAVGGVNGQTGVARDLHLGPTSVGLLKQSG